MTMNDAPVACILDGTHYTERLAWIARLNQDGLLSHQRYETALELRYAAAARDRVHALVREESECCPFLTFALDGSGSDLQLTITAPEMVREAADQCFEPFLTFEAPCSTVARRSQPGKACCT